MALLALFRQDGMSEPELLPPYHRGSATSKLRPLEQGHEQVQLSREELGKLACWIDLLVPYCGDYLESQAWSDGEAAFYARALAKRQRAQAKEDANLRALIEAQTTVRPPSRGGSG